MSCGGKLIQWESTPLPCYGCYGKICNPRSIGVILLTAEFKPFLYFWAYVKPPPSGELTATRLLSQRLFDIAACLAGGTETKQLEGLPWFLVPELQNGIWTGIARTWTNARTRFSDGAAMILPKLAWL